jgi:hypothetical protein
MRNREFVGLLLPGPHEAEGNAIVEQRHNDRFAVVPVLAKSFTRHRLMELCHAVIYHTTSCETALEAGLRAMCLRRKEII